MRACDICHGIFPGKETLKAHKKAVHWHPCDLCKKRFSNPSPLQDHKKSTGHCYCHECGISFAKVKDLDCHDQDAHNDNQFECCDCGRSFDDEEPLDTHCCDCGRVFKAVVSLKQHTAAESSACAAARAKRLQLEAIKRQQQQQLEKEQRKQGKKPKAVKNIPCTGGAKCSKKFAYLSALLDHLESGACRSGINRDQINRLVIANDHDHHITKASITGAQSNPDAQVAEDRFHATAGKSFLEADSQDPAFPSGPAIMSDFEDQDFHAYEYAVSECSDLYDGVPLTPGSGEMSCELPSPAISRRNSGSWSLMSAAIYTPAESSMVASSPADLKVDDGRSELSIAPLVVHGQPSPSSSSLRCLLCPMDRKPFKSSTALDMHLRSVAHAPKIFHCPIALAPVSSSSMDGRSRVFKEFRTLSGLARHLEAGACAGGLEIFRNAARYLQSRLTILGHGGMRLLPDCQM